MSVISSGLLLEYRFDEGSGQSIADYSGNGYDAVLGSSAGDATNDPVWTSYGVNFPNDLSIIRTGIGTGSLPTSGITVMMLVKVTAFGSYMRLFEATGGTYPTLWISSGNNQWGLVTGGSIHTSQSANLPSDWLVLSYTISTSAPRQKIFRNAGLAASATLSGLSWSPSGSWDIGRGYSFSEAFNGQCAYFLLYDRELSEAEIATNYNEIAAAVSGRGIALRASGATCSYVGADTTTLGDWIGGYGSDGYVIPGGVNGSTDAASYPSYVSGFSASGNSAWTYVPSTDSKFLKYTDGSARTGKVWYTGSSMTFSMLVTGEKQLSLYFIQGDDGFTRDQTIEIRDPGSNTILDTRTISNFGSSPQYLKWTVSGDIDVVVRNNGGSINALVGAFLWDSVADIDLTGTTGGLIEVTGGAGGGVEWDPPIDLAGTAGGAIDVTGGAYGGVGNPCVGLTGGLIAVTGGSAGSVFTLISGTSGGLLEIAAGTGGALFSQISGTAGGTISVSGGTTGLIYNRTEQAFLVWIRGTEVSRFVKDPSVSVTAQLAGRASAQFVVIPHRGESFVPAVRDEVIVLHQASGFRLFAGMVESVSDDLWPGTRGHREYTVKCTDYGVICERRAIAKWYTIAMGSYAPIVAYDIHASFLEGTGITYEHGGQPAGAYFGEIFFNWISVAQALDQICQAGGLEWRIDYYKALKLISRSEGYEAAPFSIGQDDGNWRRLVATTSRGKFANRVIVRNSQDIAAVWTDEITLNGAAIYPTTYPLEVKPVVTLDDVEQIVCEMSQRGSTAGWQWYYIAGGTGIFPNPASVPGSGTLRVMYPSKVSFVAIAEDEESIAAVGRHEHIEEVKDLQSVEAMQAHADSVLAQRSAIATTLEIETDRAGLEPGQLVTVSANDIAGDFLIEQTDCQEIAHSYPRWKVRASDASLKLGSGTAYLARILARQRQALDRIDSHIAFVLAETIPGITNPGLSTGLKNAVRVARKNGYLKQVRLYFLSVASTLTTSDIEIDILRDGTSIFPSGQYMRFPAGAEAVQTQFWFAMNPYQVFAGDVFTINVISADAAAMDGWLEIQVQG